MSVTITPSEGFAPLLVTYNVETTLSGVISYDWWFGDGGTDTNKSGVYTYPLVGDYWGVCTVSGSLSSGVESELFYVGVGVLDRSNFTIYNAQIEDRTGLEDLM